MLLKVVASYKDSCGYFYHGDDEAEADNYWLDQIEEAKKMIQKLRIVAKLEIGWRFAKKCTTLFNIMHMRMGYQITFIKSIPN